MSLFFCGFFVKKSGQSEDVLKAHFQTIWTTEGSEWWVCNWDRDYIDGVFEPDSSFTIEKSAALGDVLFLCMDTMNDQFEYEHSRDGELIRKLSWCTDGSESTWMTVDGELEGWEKDSLFGERNLVSTLEYLGYSIEDEPEEVQQTRQQEMKERFARFEYTIDSPWPRGDAYFALVAAKVWGIELPETFGS